MEEFYKIEEFKKKNEAVFIDEFKIAGITFNHEKPIVQWQELLSLIREDTLHMSYHDLHYADFSGATENIGSLRLEYKRDEDNTLEKIYIRHYYMNINNKYVKTINWLKEQGYM